MLLYGAFLAWKTRKIKLTIANDSKFIGLAIYSVAVFVGLAILATVALRDNVDLHFAAMALLTLIATTCTTCLVFVPKVSNESYCYYFRLSLKKVILLMLPTSNHKYRLPTSNLMTNSNLTQKSTIIDCTCFLYLSIHQSNQYNYT